RNARLEPMISAVSQSRSSPAQSQTCQFSQSLPQSRPSQFGVNRILRPIFAILISFLASLMQAQEPVTETAAPDQGTESESAPLPESEQRVQSLFPVLISLGVHAGYDSNAHTTGNGQGSWFASQELTLSYDRSRGPNKIDLVASVQAVERFS